MRILCSITVLCAAISLVLSVENFFFKKTFVTVESYFI